MGSVEDLHYYGCQRCSSLNSVSERWAHDNPEYIMYISALDHKNEQIKNIFQLIN